jgi:uncharacterized protein (DUF305 family)
MMGHMMDHAMMDHAMMDHAMMGHMMGMMMGQGMMGQGMMRQGMMGPGMMQGMGPSGPRAQQQAAAASPAVQAYMQANQAMMQAMMTALSGDADRDFATQMIAHHQGAIDMARVELQYGTDAQLRKLAENVIATQQKEIEEMAAWLEAHP